MDENFIRVLTNLSNSIVGSDASQLYLFSRCQAMPIGLYTRWELNSEPGKLKPRQNKTRIFENMVMLFFQRVRPQCKVESFYMTGTQKKLDAYIVDCLCRHCNTEFEAKGFFYHYYPCQEACPYLTEEEIQRGIKKKELDELRKQFIEAKGYDVIEIYERLGENVQGR